MKKTVFILAALAAAGIITNLIFRRKTNYEKTF